MKNSNVLLVGAITIITSLVSIELQKCKDKPVVQQLELPANHLERMIAFAEIPQAVEWKASGVTK